MKFKLIGLVLASFLLTGCLNLEDPKVFVEPFEVEYSDVLEADPYKICNTFSTNSTILLNNPCPNDSVTIGRIKLDGATIESTIKLKLEVFKDDVVVYTDEITPVPSTAASSTKIVSHIFSLEDSSLGNIRLVLSNEFDELTINLKALQ